MGSLWPLHSTPFGPDQKDGGTDVFGESKGGWSHRTFKVISVR